VDSEYGKQYRTLYRQHWWWRARERIVLDALRAHRPPDGLRAILDVGCGDGLLFDALLAIDGVALVEGVEPAVELVTPDGPHRARIHVAPFDMSFAPPRRYSAVLMLDVLEHLPDPEAALQQAMLLLAPEGVLLLTVPAFMSLWTRHDDLNHHYTRYTRRTLGALACAAGMQVREMRYFFRWLVPAKLVTRLIEALVPGAPAPPTLPPQPINQALYAISRLEERLLARVPVPFGTSLLAVGRRRDPS